MDVNRVSNTLPMGQNTIPGEVEGLKSSVLWETYPVRLCLPHHSIAGVSGAMVPSAEER
jgi:hypothetical protein